MFTTLFTIVLLVSSGRALASEGLPGGSKGGTASPFEATHPTIRLSGSPLFLSPWNACGQVAVFAVCNDLGMEVSLDVIASHIPVGENGTSMKSLVDGANALGLHAKGVQVSAAALLKLLSRDADARAIALVDGNHWVALLSARGTSIEAFSYPRKSIVELDEFQERFSGRAVLVMSRRRTFASWEVLLAAVTSAGSLLSIALVVLVRPRSVAA